MVQLGLDKPGGAPGWTFSPSMPVPRNRHGMAKSEGEF